MSYNTWEKDFCLEQADYPRRIELNPAWHEAFAAMQQLTAEDGHERWGLIGVTEARDRALISEPQSFVRGGKGSVDGEDKLQAMWAAEQKGIPYVVGTVHSHPSFGKYAIRKFNLTIGAENTFSAMDLYGCIDHRAEPAVHFVVGPTETRLVCRCRETELLPPFTPSDAFENFWFRYYLTHLLSMDAVNLAIAKRHRLVLYGGKPDQPLSRIYPTSAKHPSLKFPPQLY